MAVEPTAMAPVDPQAAYNGGASSSTNFSDPKIAEQARLQEEEFNRQMALLALQQKANDQNNFFTACSALYKGQSDVLSSIANNCK